MKKNTSPSPTPPPDPGVGKAEEKKPISFVEPEDIPFTDIPEDEKDTSTQGINTPGQPSEEAVPFSQSQEAQGDTFVWEGENPTVPIEEKKPSEWKRNILAFFKLVKNQWNKARAWYEENKKKQSQKPPRNKSRFKYWRLVTTVVVISLVTFLAYRYFDSLKAFLLKGFHFIEAHEFLFYCILGTFLIFFMSLFWIKETKNILRSALVVTSLATVIYFFGPWTYENIRSLKPRIKFWKKELVATQKVAYNQDSVLGVIAGLRADLKKQKDLENSLQRKDQEIASLKEKLDNKVSESKTMLVEKIAQFSDTASKAENARLRKLLASKDTQITSHEKTIRELYELLKKKKEEKKGGYILPKGARVYN